MSHSIFEYNRIIIYISNFLSYADNFSFGLTCKKIHNCVKRNFRDVLISQLELFTPLPKEFLDAVERYNVVISGSFILYCLYYPPASK